MSSYFHRHWNRQNQDVKDRLTENYYQLDLEEPMDSIKHVPRQVTSFEETEVTDVTPESTIRLPECTIAAEVMKITAARAATGMEEYKVTLADNDTKDSVGWIDDTVEELLDAANYLTRLKKSLQLPSVRS